LSRVADAGPGTKMGLKVHADEMRKKYGTKEPRGSDGKDPRGSDGGGGGGGRGGGLAGGDATKVRQCTLNR
jgi:hypothetical protein